MSSAQDSGGATYDAESARQLRNDDRLYDGSHSSFKEQLFRRWCSSTGYKPEPDDSAHSRRLQLAADGCGVWT